MLGVSSLLDFLLGLISDDDAAAEFERDPQGVLRANGFDDLCGQDVYDMAPVLGDHHGVRFIGSGGGGGGGDAIHAIRYIQKSYVAKPEVHNNYYNYEYSHTIDQRIIVDGDGNTIIVDSYNTKNVGVENNGVITDSAIVGGDGTAINNSGNSDDDFNNNTVASNNNVGNDTDIHSDNVTVVDNDGVDIDSGPEPAAESSFSDSSSDSSTEYQDVEIDSYDETPIDGDDI